MIAWLVAATLWAGLVALGDLRLRRIPNAAVAAGFVLMALRTQLGAEPGLAAALLQSALGLLALWPAWRMGVLGGGDVKLGAVVAAGPIEDFIVALAVALAGAAGLGLRNSRRLRLLPGEQAPELRLPFAPLLLGPWALLAWLGHG